MLSNNPYQPQCSISELPAEIFEIGVEIEGEGHDHREDEDDNEDAEDAMNTDSPSPSGSSSIDTGSGVALFSRFSLRMYVDTGAKSLLTYLFSGQNSTSLILPNKSLH